VGFSLECSSDPRNGPPQDDRPGPARPVASADRDQLRLILEPGIQRLIEIEASAVIGADPYERAADRATHRNGHRPKPLDTGVGRLELQIPKLRVGSFFPTLLEPRRGLDRRS